MAGAGDVAGAVVVAGVGEVVAGAGAVAAEGGIVTVTGAGGGAAPGVMTTMTTATNQQWPVTSHVGLTAIQQQEGPCVVFIPASYCQRCSTEGTSLLLPTSLVDT